MKFINRKIMLIIVTGLITFFPLVGNEIAQATSATDIAAGAGHACSIISDGTVRCWGSNWVGQLGDGTTIDSPTPVTVNGITTATAIAASGYHTCATLSDGTVRCWGLNDFGQLGDGTTTDSLTPVTVSGITTAIAVSTSHYSTCVVLADGTVRCWGRNNYGQLGNGTTIDSTTPVMVIGITTATAIAGGEEVYHACSLLSDGTVRCWGANWYGQLGDGTGLDSSLPVMVSGITTATAIAA